MKKIILHIIPFFIVSNAVAQACPDIDGLSPAPVIFGLNGGNPQSTFATIPFYWNRFYKVDELTGQVVPDGCTYSGDPNIHSFAACVCFLSGTYFRKVSDLCDLTGCGADTSLPKLPITNNNNSAGNWSQSAAWLANEVPDIRSSPSVMISRSLQIDADLNFPQNHWLILTGGNSTILSGKTVTCNSLIQMRSSAQLQNFGTLKGTGQIFGTLMNSGTLSPGNSPGKFTIVGNYTADNAAVHEIEIASANLYDTINVLTDVSFASGSVVLNGTLHVSLLNGFNPLLGDSFKIFSFTSSTGSFANLNLPALSPGLFWSVYYNSTDVTLKVEAGTLPLHFIAMNVNYKNNAVHVNWATENEINIKTFEVERSIDGARFKKISTIGVIEGNSNKYECTDAAPLNGNNYYRIKAVDQDDKFMYSLVKLIKVDSYKFPAIYPNPVTKGGVLHLDLQNRTATKIEIINTTGQLVYTSSLKLTGRVTIPIYASLSAGQYIMKIISDNKTEISRIQIQ